MTGIGQDAALLYEAESEEVVVARDTFASLRQYLVTLQDEVPLLPACGHSQGECAGTQEYLPPRTPTTEAVEGGRCMPLYGELVAVQLQGEQWSDDCVTPQCLGLRITAQQAPRLTRCGMQTLAVGASLGSGGPRARKLQRLKSSFRSSSNISRLSTVQLIQQIQVSIKEQFMSFLMARLHMAVERQVGFACACL